MQDSFRLTNRPQPRTIEVDGVGRVEVSRDFFDLPPARQQQVVEEIAQFHQSQQQPDRTAAAPVVGRPSDSLPGVAGLPSAAGVIADQAVGVVQGGAHVLDNAAELAQGAYNNTAGLMLGQSDSATQASQSGQGFEGLAANLGQGGQVGNMAGQIGTAAFLTRGMGGPAAQGAAQGALLSEAETPLGLAGDVALGWAGGYLGDRIVRGVGAMIAPEVPAAARRLHERGVAITPGQAVPALRRGEEQLRSRPFIGGQIDRVRQQGYRDFNRVAVEEPIAPYNEFAAQYGRPPIQIPQTAEGHEAIRLVGDGLSERYEQVIPSLRFQVDPQAIQDFAALRQTLQNGDMSPVALYQFETIVRNQIISRVMGPNGQPTAAIDGRTFRQIEQNIGRQIRRFSRSDAPDDQATAEAFSQLQDLMQAGLRRNNPDAAAELEALHAGWARLVRVEGAADGAVNGLFSPLQFRRSVRRNDNSVRHRAVARGEALSQQLADDASDVLPSQYPDSGTAGRSQMNPFDPRFYLGALQGALYGPGTQQLITGAVMTPRPAFAKPVADALRALPAASAGSAAALGIKDALLGF